MTSPATGTARVLVLKPGDDVGVAVTDLEPGDQPEQLAGVTVRGSVPRGHKVALRAVAPGDPVRKYGQLIGSATAPISPGEHVHTHNLGFDPARGGAGRRRGTGPQPGHLPAAAGGAGGPEESAATF